MNKIIFAIGLLTTFFLLLNFIFSLILDQEDKITTIDHRFNRLMAIFFNEHSTKMG